MEPTNDLVSVREGLLRLRQQFEDATSTPGLCHVIRVPVGPPEAEESELRLGWEEFLNDAKPFGFTQYPFLTGPQACFFGAEERLSDFMGMAAEA